MSSPCFISGTKSQTGTQVGVGWGGVGWGMGEGEKGEEAGVSERCTKQSHYESKVVLGTALSKFMYPNVSTKSFNLCAVG